MKKTILSLTFVGIAVALGACNSGSPSSSQDSGDKTVNYAYFTNYNSDAYTKCNVSESAQGSGLFNCNPFKPSGVAIVNGFGIVLNNGFAYITSDGINPTNTITQCQINHANGELQDCIGYNSQTDLAGVVAPTGLALNNGYAYIMDNSTNGNQGKYVYCSVSSNDGSLSNCRMSGTTQPYASNVQDLTINNGFIYFANFGNNTYAQCMINSLDGSIDSCTTSATLNTNPVGIDFYNGLAYILGADGTYEKCQVNNTTGTFSGCSSAAIPGANYPTAISVNNGSMYIVNNHGTSYIQCSINNIGELSNCTNYGNAQLSNSQDMTFGN